MKILLQTLFFFLSITQICFAQWYEQNLLETPDWVKYYGNYDYPVNTSYKFVTFDKAGYIYAIGSTEGAFPRTGISIRSYYDSEGNLESIIEDTEFLIDWITFDSLGNIYAQGYEGNDPCIIKFDLNWTEQWKLYDYGSMVVDSMGNLFISKNEELPDVSNSEIFTSKYSPAGELEWENHFQWTSNSMNYPSQLQVDRNGGVVILGISYSPPSPVNPVVVKYASDGSEEWRARYNSADLHYIALGLAIDDSGSVYISVPDGDTPNVETHTVKYSNTGLQRWAITNPGFPRKLILDDQGNIYLAIQSNGVSIITVKYNNNGYQQWAKELNPPYQTSYHPANITVVNDNIYVVGYSESTYIYKGIAVKYSSQGNEQWVFTSQDTLDYHLGLAFNHEGDICFVSNNPQKDGVVLKVNSNGIQEWSDKYIGVKYPIDFTVDSGVDSLHNIYICGTRSVFRNSSKGLTLLKYNEQGQLLWSVVDDSTEFLTFPKLNVFVDGTLVVSYQIIKEIGGNYESYQILKCFDSEGNYKWNYEYLSPFSEGLISDFNILNDQAGYLYLVFGQYINGSPTWDSNILIKKFSKLGNQIWSEEINEVSPGGTGFSTMDQGNEIFIFAHSTNDTVQTNYLIEIDENGQQIWQKSIEYSGNSNSIIVDLDEFVYIAGSSSDAYYSDILVKKYDSDVNQLWNYRYDGNAHFSDYTAAMQLDNEDHIIISGFCADTVGGLQTAVLISLDSSGNQRWIHKEYGTIDGEPSVIKNLTLDSDNNIYFSTCKDGDIGTYKFSDDGNILWSQQFANSSWPDVWEFPRKISINGNRLLVTGTSRYGERIYVAALITVLQYDLSISSINDPTAILPLKFELSQNFPNPFNPSTKIKYTVPQSSNVVIKVFDILGNEIETLVNEEKQTGTYELTWYAENLPSGIYFYRIQAGSFIDTKKMILLK